MQTPIRTAEPVAPAKCAACHCPLEFPAVCTGCHRLVTTDVDHFALLGLPREFDLDPGELRRRYFRLLREIHPDRRPAGSDAERISAQANRAFEVLGHPVLRAEYLLELTGGPSAVDDKTVAPEVLAETLSLREEIDEARERGDAAALESIRRTVGESQRRLQADVESLARRLPGEAQVGRELRHALNALKYTQRILEQL